MTPTTSSSAPSKQLFSARSRVRMTPVLLGYGVMLFTGGAFPFAGHVYARRLGVLGIAYLFGVIPVIILAFALDSAFPTLASAVLALWGIFHLLLPLHSMYLVSLEDKRADGE